MTVDQNVSFYEEQIQLFSAVHSHAGQSIKSSEKDLQAQRATVTELRERIRDIREHFARVRFEFPIGGSNIRAYSPARENQPRRDAAGRFR